MQVYSGYSYFVSFHTNGNEREGQIVSGADLGQFMVDHKVFMVEIIECWECYTKNPETGELIQKFPDFDCVITSGYPPHVDVDAVDFLDCEKY